MLRLTALSIAEADENRKGTNELNCHEDAQNSHGNRHGNNRADQARERLTGSHHKDERPVQMDSELSSIVEHFLPRYDATILIDADDLHILTDHKWKVRSMGNTRYVTRNHAGRTLFLHREIMEPEDGKVVDHIDGNGLNNSRRNMRALTHQQNLWNRPRHAGPIGASWHKASQSWRAYIVADSVKVDLGYYDTEHEARVVRDYFSIRLRGNIGTLNFEWDGLPEIDFSKLTRKAHQLLKSI